MMYIYIIHIIYTFLVASPALKSKNTPFNPYPSLSNVGQSSLYARDTIIFVGRFQILTCTIILILVGKNTILLVKSKILSVQSTSVGTSTFLLLNSLIFPTKLPVLLVQFTILLGLTRAFGRPCFSKVPSHPRPPWPVRAWRRALPAPASGDDLWEFLYVIYI